MSTRRNSGAAPETLFALSLASVQGTTVTMRRLDQTSAVAVAFAVFRFA